MSRRARASLFRLEMLSTRKGKKGLRWITFDDIMMSCVAVAHIKKDSSVSIATEVE